MAASAGAGPSDDVNADQRDRRLLFVLKSANLGLTILYQFLLLAALARSVSDDVFPWVLFIGAIGSYIINSDVGFTGYIYAFLRKRQIHAQFDECAPMIAATLTAYFLLPLLATAVAAVVIPLAFDQTAAIETGLTLFFASIVFSLPWTLVRNFANALDLFVTIEKIEFARRMSFLAAASMMFAGLPFFGFAAISILIWAVAFTLVARAFRRHPAEFSFASPLTSARFIADNRGNFLKTGAYAGVEFVIYNFPYLLIPALSLAPVNIVLFDLFYKVTRFSRVAYNVPIHTLLPYQTKAYHQEDYPTVRQYHRWVTLAAFAMFSGASLILFFFGQAFFTFLIDGAAEISNVMIAFMICAMLANVIQTPSGTFIVAIGAYDTLVKISLSAFAVMVAVVAATYILQLSFQAFMAVYVAVYFGYAVAYYLTYRNFARAL